MMTTRGSLTPRVNTRNRRRSEYKRGMQADFDAVDVERLRRRRTVKWSLYGPDVLAAWVAEMDFDVAPVVRAAILDAVDREDFGYIAPDLSELTIACADFLTGSYGWTVSPARIFPVADVLGGIGAALDALVEPGAPVVVPTPAYPPFFEVIELTGRPPVAAPMTVDDGRDVLDLDAIDAALASGARAVLLCSPHNPTGRVFTRTELTALATIVDRHGARVVADEVHAPLVYPGSEHLPYATVSDAAAEHAITVTSASKAFNLAGLKCAQVVASNHHDAARWRKLRVFEVPGPTPVGIAASTAAYGAGRPWLQELVTYLDGNRHALLELLAEQLPGVECRLPEATFLAWLDCAALGWADPARSFLDAGRVAVSDGPPFGPGCEQQVRCNFATSRDLLERIVGAMGEAARNATGAG
jgi:cystathionine beta-lyase